MELGFRDGRPEDIHGVLEVYNHYVLTCPATFEISPVEPSSRKEWLDGHLRGGAHRLYVAVERGERVVGWASTSPFRARPAYATTVESSVYCRPEFQRQGVASRLYRELFRSIAHEDVERIVAGITVPNPASTGLHIRFGFRHVCTFTRGGRMLGRFWAVAWFERPLLLG